MPESKISSNECLYSEAMKFNSTSLFCMNRNMFYREFMFLIHLNSIINGYLKTLGKGVENNT